MNVFIELCKCLLDSVASEIRTFPSCSVFSRQITDIPRVWIFRLKHARVFRYWRQDISPVIRVARLQLHHLWHCGLELRFVFSSYTSVISVSPWTSNCVDLALWFFINRRNTVHHLIWRNIHCVYKYSINFILT